MAAASDTVIAWTPTYWRGRDETRGMVALAPRPPFDAVKGFAFWVYATETGQSDETALAQVFIHFNTLVVRDGIDPKVAHAAFLGIDEYRAAVSPEIQGDA